MKQQALIAFAVLALAASGASAQHSNHGAPAKPASAKPAAGGALADGEVRKVDKTTNRITIKHGEIKSIDMPPMTMVFKAKDPAMLDQVKAGDKIRFDAAKEGSDYVVTRIEK